MKVVVALCLLILCSGVMAKIGKKGEKIQLRHNEKRLQAQFRAELEEKVGGNCPRATAVAGNAYTVVNAIRQGWGLGAIAVPQAQIDEINAWKNLAQRHASHHATDCKFGPDGNKFKRAAVADAAVARLQDPGLIDQGHSALCGPACATYWGVLLAPAIYTKLVMGLCDVGEATVATQGGDWKVKSSATLQAAGGRDLDPVDWIVLAAIRETENTVFDIENDLSAIREMTWLPSMSTFMAKMTNKPSTSTSTIAWGETASIKKAEDALKAGGAACWLINDKLVNGGDWTVSIPTHWIAILGDMKDVAPNVNIRVWTWASNYDITTTKENVISLSHGMVTTQ